MTKDDVNTLIDLAVHPRARKEPLLWLADLGLHCIADPGLRASLIKAARFLPGELLRRAPEGFARWWAEGHDS